jgi:tetratricopeptide (TPR) repeat protein
MARLAWVLVAATTVAWGCGEDESSPARRAPRANPSAAATPPAKAAPASDGGATDGDSGEAGPSDEEIAAAAAAEAAAENQRRLKGYQLWAMGRALGEGEGEGEQADPALQAYREARDTLPDNGWLRLELAKFCLSQGQQDCAVEEAEAAQNRAEGNVALQARAYEVLGQAHAAADRTAEARQAYLEVLKNRPDPEVVVKIQQLSEEPVAPDSTSTTIFCPGAAPDNQRAIAAAEGTAQGRDRSVCPLLDAPYEDLQAGGRPSQVHILASLSPHPQTEEVLLGQGGLGASGAFDLLLVRAANEQASVMKLNDGFRRRNDEIVSALSAKARRITLGPSRPALVIELATRGWRPVSKRKIAAPFERHELFVVGRHLNREKTLAHQITLARYHQRTEHCWLGEISEETVETGSIWLEDLDLNGVPEICQETRESLGALPLWLGHDSPEIRVQAECHRWVASGLSRARHTVPTLLLDDMDRERSVGQVLEVSRLPTQLRHTFQKHIGNQTVIAAKNMHLSRTGMSALAVVADDTAVKALVASAGDEVVALRLGRIGRWRHLEAAIDITDPHLIAIEVEAQGLEGRPRTGDPGGARRWLHLIASDAGVPPRLAFSTEIRRETPLSETPCPSVVEGSHERQRRDGTPFLVINKTRRTGPGSKARTKAHQEECQQFGRWLKAPTEGASEDADRLPPTAEQLCPIGVEKLATERFSPTPDGRYAKTTLPEVP